MFSLSFTGPWQVYDLWFFSLLCSPFSDTNPRATEELWYKRAVDRYEVDQGMSFVISVPYDAGTRSDSLVTATRAIFVRRKVYEINEFRSAPVRAHSEKKDMQLHFVKIKLTDKLNTYPGERKMRKCCLIPSTIYICRHKPITFFTYLFIHLNSQGGRCWYSVWAREVGSTLPKYN